VTTKACGRCCPAGTGSGYIVMCPCHGWPYVGTVHWSYRRNQWGGGLAKRATTADAAVAVLAVVAAAITAIAVFVVVLVPVVIGATVSAIGRVRRRGRRWLGRRGHSVGVERRQGSWRPGTVHVNLLQ
jgi:hypothetical protein